MKLGAHRDGLPESVVQADSVYWYAPPNLGWDLAGTVASSTVPTQVCDSLEAIIAGVKAEAAPGTQVVVMSNGGFGGLHGKLAKPRYWGKNYGASIGWPRSTSLAWVVATWFLEAHGSKEIK
jgi:UDP-N-acetylmuramate-alanine ligase